MSLTSSHASAPKKADALTQLCVVVGCHHLICALPVQSIERLALPEAARSVSPAGGRGDPPAGGALPGVVQVGEERYATWDLGALLGLGTLAQSWVLLRVAHGGKQIPLALRTGTCLAVHGVRQLLKLPPAIFRTRPAALTHGFASASIKGLRYQASIGLWIDPARLWEAHELQASAAALARAGAVTPVATREQ